METGFVSTGGYSYPGTKPIDGFPGATNNPAKSNSNETSQFLGTFRASLHSLGDFPDKYIINKLTQQAGLQQQVRISEYEYTFRLHLPFAVSYVHSLSHLHVITHPKLASSISGLIEGMIADSRVNWER